MNELFRKYKWLRFILGILLLAFGVITIVFAATNSGGIAEKTLCILLAVYFYVIGLFLLLVSVIADRRLRINNITSGLLSAGAFIGLGIVFSFVNEMTGVIQTIVKLAIPSLLIGIGAVALVKFIVLMTTKSGRLDAKNWIIALIVAAGGLTAGIIFICNQNDLLLALEIILGAVFCLIGLVIIIQSLIKKEA